MADHKIHDFSDDPQVAGTTTLSTSAILGIILLSLGAAFFVATSASDALKETATPQQKKAVKTPPAPAPAKPVAKP